MMGEAELRNGSFKSRRSSVYGTKGAVATSQPIASDIGMSILKKGGNAADAAVAIAAALNVTEPTGTGIGGDCFCLFYSSKKRTVEGINGTGRCPKNLSIKRLREEYGIEGLELPLLSPHTVTVPGACAGWIDTLERFGTMSIGEVLQPAIDLAENGFPVSPITAMSWRNGESVLKMWPHANELLLHGRAPRAGEIFKNPTLANTFREVAKHGKKGFYEGRIGNAIVDILTKLGGTMTLEDLKEHKSTMDAPISVNYRGIDVWEMPPNGQGITALIALNILEGFDLQNMKHNSPEYLHFLIEAMRLAFADSRYYVADPTMAPVPVNELLSKEYATKRRQLIDPTRAQTDVQAGVSENIDSEGNACSFINSNYCGFGTGIIPEGCGFTLQNRGANFRLEEGHPNALAPNKRPYHTIIPGMATKDGDLWAPFGVMGGFMQPQGHVQVLLNIIDHNMDPQEALDAPRFLITDGTSGGGIVLEEGISEQTIRELIGMGHRVMSPHPDHVLEEGKLYGETPQAVSSVQVLIRETAWPWVCADMFTTLLLLC